MPEAQTPTVLIVDDEDMVATALRSFLELETSYRILTHTSPDTALDELEAEPVNVVIADFMMPEMDGITFLRHVREKKPQATRILLTGYADKENAIRAINEAGLYYYLEATRGLYARPAGPGSERLRGVGSLSHEDMLDYLRRCRVYLYTGTQPASYTLGLMEAMLTGIPDREDSADFYTLLLGATIGMSLISPTL